MRKQNIEKVLKEQKEKEVKQHIFPSEWIWADEIDDYFRRTYMMWGTLLHLCCGTSTVGHARLDINKKMNCTVVGDAMEYLIKGFFHHNQFDYVLIDPPFDWYNPNSKVIKEMAKKLGYKEAFGRLVSDWQYAALNVSKRALITRRTLQTLNFFGHGGFDEKFIVVRDHRPSATLFQIDYKGNVKLPMGEVLNVV